MSAVGSVTRPQRSPAGLKVPLVPQKSQLCPEVLFLAFHGNFLHFSQAEIVGAALNVSLIFLYSKRRSPGWGFLRIQTDEIHLHASKSGAAKGTGQLRPRGASHWGR